MIPIWVKVLLIAGVFGLFVYSYKYTYDLGGTNAKNEVIAKQIEKIPGIIQKDTAITNKVIPEKIREKIVYRTLTEEVIKYVEKDPIRIKYCPSVFSDDGFRMYNDAITGKLSGVGTTEVQ